MRTTASFLFLCLWAFPSAVLATTNAVIPKEVVAIAGANPAEGSVACFQASEPQQLAQGLLDSGLLSCLNRAEASHTLLDEPAERHVEVWWVLDPSGGRWYFAYAEGKLEASLLILSAPLTTGEGGGVHQEGRLDTIRRLLSTFRRSAQLQPVNGADPNPTLFRGKSRGWRVWAEYRPEEDAIWYLKHH